MNSKSASKSAVVVGVDGSPASSLALDWAVDEATRRGLRLHIIHAFSFGYPMTGIGLGYAIEGLSDLAVGVRKEAIARARRANPELVVTWDQPAYSPASALVDESETADTLVVGARGMSAVAGVLLGSVSIQVAAHARCPVIVVHEPPTPTSGDAPVVVGVDGSVSSTNAIAYAFEQASSRSLGLTVVHARWLDRLTRSSASAIWPLGWQTFAQEERALVAELLAGWQEKYPDVTVRRHNVRELPVEALIRQGEHACMVVVGSRGRGGFGGLLLGSVSQGVMHRAKCPVAIVHAPRESQRVR